MPEKNDSYESPNVLRVVADVRAGDKNKRDLEICGCPICTEALRILNEGRTNKMKIIGGIENNTPNSELTTAAAMSDAGYEWDEKKRYWSKGVPEE